MAKLTAAQQAAIAAERSALVTQAGTAQARGDSSVVAATQRRIVELDLRSSLHTNDTNIEAGH